MHWLSSSQRHCCAGIERGFARSGVGSQGRLVGRALPRELRQLIRRMAADNPTWGQERIANELLLKLGLHVSPRTIRKYLAESPAAPGGSPRGDQRWSTFLKNHATAIIACDFCVVASATFRILYVLVVMEHSSRRIVHINGTWRNQPPVGWSQGLLLFLLTLFDNVDIRSRRRASAQNSW